MRPDSPFVSLLMEIMRKIHSSQAFAIEANYALAPSARAPRSGISFIMMFIHYEPEGRGRRRKRFFFAFSAHRENVYYDYLK